MASAADEVVVQELPRIRRLLQERSGRRACGARSTGPWLPPADLRDLPAEGLRDQVERAVRSSTVAAETLRWMLEEVAAATAGTPEMVEALTAAVAERSS